MPDPPQTLPLEIDVHTVHRMLQDEQGWLLLDCREQAESEIARLNSSLLIPMGEITQRLSELEPYREKRIVVHCHLGGRSLMVTEWLRAQGYANVQNMTGGIDAWSVEIDKTVPRY